MTRENESVIGDGPTGKPMVRGRHFSDELVRDAAAYFSKRAERTVSENEARGMLADLTDFCGILLGKDGSV